MKSTKIFSFLQKISKLEKMNFENVCFLCGKLKVFSPNYKSKSPKNSIELIFSITQKARKHLIKASCSLYWGSSGKFFGCSVFIQDQSVLVSEWNSHSSTGKTCVSLLQELSSCKLTCSSFLKVFRDKDSQANKFLWWQIDMFDPGRSEGLGSLQVVYCSAPLCNSIELTQVNEHGRKFKFSHQGELKVGVNHWLKTSLDFLKKILSGMLSRTKFLVHPTEIWPNMFNSP